MVMIGGQVFSSNKKIISVNHVNETNTAIIKETDKTRCSFFIYPLLLNRITFKDINTR